MSENAAAGTKEVIPEREMPAHLSVEKRELRVWAVDEDEGTRARELEGGKGVLPPSHAAIDLPKPLPVSSQ